MCSTFNFGANLNHLQWYALPTGLYLLIISYFEWHYGHKHLARWVDYAAMVLMFCSLFWQTLILGWIYFFILIMEGLASVWWGSARRLRRFLYAGIVAVMLGTVAPIDKRSQLHQSMGRLWSNWFILGDICYFGGAQTGRY